MVLKIWQIAQILSHQIFTDSLTIFAIGATVVAAFIGIWDNGNFFNC